MAMTEVAWWVCTMLMFSRIRMWRKSGKNAYSVGHTSCNTHNPRCDVDDNEIMLLLLLLLLLLMVMMIVVDDDESIVCHLKRWVHDDEDDGDVLADEDVAEQRKERVQRRPHVLRNTQPHKR
jgi:hypothetical protein